MCVHRFDWSKLIVITTNRYELVLSVDSCVRGTVISSTVEGRRSTEEDSVLKWWGKFGDTYIKGNLRGLDVPRVKPEQLQPLRKFVCLH